MAIRPLPGTAPPRLAKVTSIRARAAHDKGIGGPILPDRSPCRGGPEQRGERLSPVSGDLESRTWRPDRISEAEPTALRTDEGEVLDMLRWILDRMVERSIPPFTPDDESKMVAEEAAENGIRQAVRFVGTASVIVIGASALILYRFPPGQLTVSPPPVAVRVTSQPGAVEMSGTEDARLRQGPGDSERKPDDANEESQGKLEKLTKEREAKLRQALEDSEKKLDQANRESQRKLEDLTQERDRLQARVIDLEQQVAALSTKTKARAERDLPRQAEQPTRRVASHAVAAELTLPGQAVYHCADGRVLRDPTRCRAVHPPGAEDLASPRNVFQCGDGRTVRDPTLCKPAQTPGSAR